MEKFSNSYTSSSGTISDRRTVQMFAVLDSWAPIGYFLYGDPLVMHIIAISIKMMLIIFNLDKLHIRNSSVTFIVTLIILALTGAIADAYSNTFLFTSLLRYVAFTISMLLTLLILRESNFFEYVKYLVLVPFLAAIFHIYLYFTDGLVNSYGRYFYLGGSHPNLGGEISAIAVLAASIIFRFRLFIFITVIFFYSAFLMQARAALIVIIGLVLVRIMFGIWSMGSRHRVLSIMLIFIAGFIFLMFGGVREFIAEDILLLNDISRGLNTGFVGRDARWLMAWELFLNNPVFGNGISIFGDAGFSSPHNAFLYGLAQHGVLSLVFWIILAHRWKLILSTSFYMATIIAIGSILLIFNDRFINLNSFPFVYYIIILSMPIKSNKTCPK